MAKKRKDMEKKLVASMRQAVAIAKGEHKDYLLHKVSRDSVRLIRAKTSKA